MSEKDVVFSSKIKYNGIFSFNDFYQFAHDWLDQEMGFGVKEDKYSEKLKGDSKDVEVNWTADKGVTDFFDFEVKVTMKIQGLTKVEIKKDNNKINTNKGTVELSVKGTLIKDPEGKFEMSAFKKFLRGIYEKWIISSRIDFYAGKLAGDCDEFLSQIKAYLDLEGKK